MKKPKKSTNKPSPTAANSLNGGPTREDIATVAHSIWEQEGRPEGRDVQHWLEAEMQLRQFPKSGAAPRIYSQPREHQGMRVHRLDQ